MRTGFDGNVRTSNAGFERSRDAASRTDVNNVQLRPGLSGDHRRSGDGLHFRDDGAGLQIITDSGTALGNRLLSQSRSDLVIFGMHGPGESEPRGLAHSLVQRQVIGPRKLVQARV